MSTIKEATEYVDMVSKQQDPNLCDHSKTICVEYEYGHPARYDGISEVQCLTCGQRTGRWSGKILNDGEFEYRYGIDPSTDEALK